MGVLAVSGKGAQEKFSAFCPVQPRAKPTKNCSGPAVCANSAGRQFSSECTHPQKRQTSCREAQGTRDVPVQAHWEQFDPYSPCVDGPPEERKASLS